MLNRISKDICFRIYISKYFSRLQSLNELYSKGNKEEYLQKMQVFYSDLLRFPQVYYKIPQNNQSNTELISAFSLMPNNSVNSIYLSHTDQLLKIELLIDNKKANELNDVSETIELFLNRLYNTIFFRQRTSNLIKYSILVTGAIILVFLFAILYSPLKEKYSEEKEQYELAANEELREEKTIEGILALKDALQKYYNENKSFPKSSGGWDGVLSSFGESKEDWIPGLVPKYIKELPVDPRRSKVPTEQYMYKSDGRDFKVIAHSPLGMSNVVKIHPELVDPARPSWAFGVWSEGAKNW